MSDIAIRVENLSKLYPAHSLAVRRPGVGRAGHIGARQERHDTTSTVISAVLCDESTSNRSALKAKVASHA